ncbi:SIMPL domain-containing protein [Pseudarthrobacter sulfonivorans]|uniref:SIMPL domain-containing protein n=1 Tax=Pseudarthrobacter sulfonivorans TaxID=121292 RepID=UPI00285E4A70|nr:SIMPL domain-containing protein [Pseudarthrobacter sulfonivorans]MDR6416336.1 uncharacterized protein YggE [Pseudarthrobacter sulfonivorans]
MAGESSTRTITVTGTGTAEAPPDLLTVSVGVECRRASVGAAYADAGTTSAAVSGALRQHGLADTDIRTSGLNVRPELVWRDGEGQHVAGYVASSVLTVRVRQMASASTVIAAVVEAGGDDVRLNGLELGFADESAVMARAREAAWQDAAAAAEQFASLASARLGAVVSVAEQPLPSGPIPVARLERAVATDAISVEAGHASLGASVTVVWELQP